MFEVMVAVISKPKDAVSAASHNSQFNRVNTMTLLSRQRAYT
jgi:hypothetical protein